MEDAATAEISRCQLWQWIRHAAELPGGEQVTAQLVTIILEQELGALAEERPDLPRGRAAAIRELLTAGALRETLPRFFTTQAYREHLVERRPARV